MRTINIGVIGFGFMGRTHTYAATSLPYFYPGLPYKVCLKGVCSRRIDTAQAAKDELGFEFATDDYRALLQRGDIDAVSVCTPNNLHEGMAIDALRAGKHLYLDKPVAVTYEGARNIAGAARDSGLIAQIAFHNRAMPVVMRARELMDEGRIGDVVSFRIQYLHSGSVDGAKPVSWKQDIDIGGAGVLFDLGSHALDMLYHLAGPLDSIMLATRVLHDTRVARDHSPIQRIGDDQSVMMVRLGGGALGSVEASKIATGMNDVFRVEIHGTLGAVVFDLMEPNFLKFYDNTREERPLGGERGFTLIECMQRFPPPGGVFLPPKNAVGWVRAHIHSYYTFINAIHTGALATPTACSADDGALNQHYLECALRSEREGAWVKV